MDDRTPIISVIAPHLNQADALERCLLSLEEQSYPRACFEVIVVDNGSEVPPRDIAARFPEVRLGFEERPGPGPARNRGIELARGQILAFIDADCTADRNWLAAIADHLAQNDEGVILGGDVRIACGDARRLTALEAYESVFAYRQKDYIERQGFSGTGNLAARREDVLAVGPFGGIAEAEDIAWGRRAVARGYRIVYVPAMIVFHPARRSFEELTTKWNRHVRHAYQEWMHLGRSRAAWALRTLAVLGSALLDGRKVLVSDRIAGVGTRLRAFTVLARIRLHRARQMALILFNPREAEQWISWNRPLRPR